MFSVQAEKKSVSIEALNKKPEKEDTLTAAQRLFFWAEYKNKEPIKED